MQACSGGVYTYTCIETDGQVDRQTDKQTDKKCCLNHISLRPHVCMNLTIATKVLINFMAQEGKLGAVDTRYSIDTCVTVDTVLVTFDKYNVTLHPRGGFSGLHRSGGSIILLVWPSAHAQRSVM